MKRNTAELTRAAADHLASAAQSNEYATRNRARMRQYMRDIPKWEWHLESGIHVFDRPSMEWRLAQDRRSLDYCRRHVLNHDVTAKLELASARRLKRQASKPTWSSIWEAILEVLWPLIIIRAIRSGRKP